MEGGQLVKYILLKNWIRESSNCFKATMFLYGRGIILLSRISVQSLYLVLFPLLSSSCQRLFFIRVINLTNGWKAFSCLVTEISMLM